MKESQMKINWKRKSRAIAKRFGVDLWANKDVLWLEKALEKAYNDGYNKGIDETLRIGNKRRIEKG